MIDSQALDGNADRGHARGGVRVRCRACNGLLMVITQLHGVFCVDALGLVEPQAPA